MSKDIGSSVEQGSSQIAPFCEEERGVRLYLVDFISSEKVHMFVYVFWRNGAFNV